MVLLPPKTVLPPPDHMVLLPPGFFQPVAPAFRPGRNYAPLYGTSGRGRGYGYYGYSGGFGSTYPAMDTVGAATESPGILELNVSPHFAQVFVDDAYVGTVDDFVASGVPLEPGLHTLSLHAPDYDSVSVPVSIAAGHTVSYRAELQTTTRLASPAAPPRAASTAPFYVIPKCYFGNRPPDEASLPAGCDVRNVRKLDGPPDR
jgi:hypothetical protein